MNKYIVNHGEGAILRIELEEPEDLIMLYAYEEYLKRRIREEQVEGDMDIELMHDMCSEYMNTCSVANCISDEWEAES